MHQQTCQQDALVSTKNKQRVWLTPGQNRWYIHCLAVAVFNDDETKPIYPRALSAS
jgi:DNA-binding IclR family transcriptional regulator